MMFDDRRKRRKLEDKRRIIDAFAERPGEWRYSLDLMRQTGLRAGRFYLAIDGLEKGKLVKAKWEDRTDGRPRRRLYRQI